MGKIVQDDSREEKMAEIFNLRRPIGRITYDAEDEKLNKFELKSSSKGGVSTARDLGYNHLEKWSDMYWIIGNFKASDPLVFNSFYFLAPIHMKSWFDYIRSRLDSDAKLAKKMIEIIKKDIGVTEIEISRVEHLFKDGALLNDPNIPKGYVERNGIPIRNDYPNELRKLVQKYPINYVRPDEEFFIFS